MTSNQLSYWQLQEDKRSNAAREAETERSNLAREIETARHNRTDEKLRQKELGHAYYNTAMKAGTDVLKVISPFG